MSSKLILPLLSVFFFLAATQDATNYCITRPTECYPVSLPVCAYPINCTNSSCSQNFTNACLACQNVSMNSYTIGVCPPYIPPEGTDNNPSEEEDTVDSENELEFEEEVDEEEESSSTCTDISVAVQVGDTFVEGKFCCDVSPPTCPDRNRPVCGVLYTCIGNVCCNTIRNSCEACQDPNVQFYISGTCEDVFDVPTSDFDVQVDIEEEYIPALEGEVPFAGLEERQIWISWHS